MNELPSRWHRPLLAAALLLAGCASVAERPASQAGVDAHVAEARRVAGEDLTMLMPLCEPQPATRASGPAVATR